MPDASAAAVRPWETLTELIDSGDVAAVRRFFDGLGTAETARTISRLGPVAQERLFALLEPAHAADVLEEVSETQAAELIDDLEPTQAAAILDAMRSDRQADVLGALDRDDAEAILDAMSERGARDARELLAHDPDSAGGLMVTEYLVYRDTQTMADVLDDLRAHAEAYSDYDVQYAYVTSGGGILLGVLRLRDLLFARRQQRVVDLMIGDPARVRIDAGLPALTRFFEDHPFLGVPVVDARGRLCGVVRRAAVEEAAQRRAATTFLRVSGIGREELRSMPLVARSSRRLSWLSINVVLNMIAASVIALYQDTLAQAIILAVFLPIISDMSGCSGNQAVAVSMRELSLGLVKPMDLAHVLGKEVLLGLVNGLVLGLLLGGGALLWQGNVYLGAVVGGSLALNTIVAVCLGGALPLVLRGMRFDPALASGPILTTVTDMCGFFILLSMASAVLTKLA